MRKIDIMYLVRYGGLSLLGLLLIAMLFPVVSEGASADELVQSTTEFNARIKQSISISVPSTFNLDLTPKSGAVFAEATGKVSVTTNNASGYRLLIQSLYSSDMTSRNNSSEHVISSIPNVAKQDGFGNNTWGYYIGQNTPDDSTEYQPISTTAIVAASSQGIAEASDAMNYQLVFGVKIDNTLPAGTYSNAVMLSAVANPMEVHSLMDLTFMQDMTTRVCEMTPSAYNTATDTSDSSSEYYLKPITKQLIDIRDGNKYWVAKLADGNCWMTQNLALDLSTEKALTPYDSDVSSNWVPGSSTETSVPEKTVANYAATRSWGFGKIILTNPTSSTACDSIAAGGKITDCEWYIDVEDMTVSNDSNFSTSTSSIDENVYDAHYLIGNYYSLPAATAGTGVGLSSPESARTNPNDLVEASGSICPNGWKLPVSGRNTTATAGWPFDREDSFYKLLRAYGYPKTGDESTGNVAVSGWTVNGGDGTTTVTGSGRTRLDFTPMYFVRSGGINPTADSPLYNIGTTSYCWSATAVPTYSSSTYMLTFRGTMYVATSSNTSDHNGFPVRCLAR